MKRTLATTLCPEAGGRTMTKPPFLAHSLGHLPGRHDSKTKQPAKGSIFIYLKHYTCLHICICLCLKMRYNNIAIIMFAMRARLGLWALGVPIGLKKKMDLQETIGRTQPILFPLLPAAQLHHSKGRGTRYWTPKCSQRYTSTPQHGLKRAAGSVLDLGPHQIEWFTIVNGYQ